MEARLSVPEGIPKGLIQRCLTLHDVVLDAGHLVVRAVSLEEMRQRVDDILAWFADQS